MNAINQTDPPRQSAVLRQGDLFADVAPCRQFIRGRIKLFPRRNMAAATTDPRPFDDELPTFAPAVLP